MLTPSGVLHLQKIESFHCRFSCWRVPSILYIPHPFKKASSLFVVILRAHFLCIPRFFGWLELEVDSCQNTWAVNIGSSLFFKEHLETHPLAELVVCVWETHFLARPCLWYFDDSLHYVFRWCESCTLLLHHRMTIFFYNWWLDDQFNFTTPGFHAFAPQVGVLGRRRIYVAAPAHHVSPFPMPTFPRDVGINGHHCPATLELNLCCGVKSHVPPAFSIPNSFLRWSNSLFADVMLACTWAKDASSLTGIVCSADW